ncbi:MAG: cation transporter, partial [Rhodospirillales bacterium]|nr:cation transporter [Rhodospirillales bacterium]
WPDLIVAGIMASLFLWSAASIIRQARGEIIESRDLAGLSI